MNSVNLSANSLKKQISELSFEDRIMVSNLINHLSARPRKRKTNILGLLSLKFVEWFSPKSDLTDEEVDDYINSVRAKENEHRN